jgi:hypothetical protein
LNTKRKARKRREKMIQNSDEFSTIKISSNRAVNDLARQQELCLIQLIQHIEKPFKDKWEWTEWHRQAIALQLSQHSTNDFFMDFQGLWDYLIEGNGDRDRRDYIIYMIHNHLEKTFAQAREELSERESDVQTE